MTTATYNYGWLMPDPGGSANTWGNILNGATQAIDAALWSINTQVTVNTLAVARGPDGGPYGQIEFLNNGSTQERWVLGESSEAEGAGNTGTNFLLNAYDNSGNVLGNVFEVLRSDQSVTFQQAVTVGGALNVGGALTSTGSVTFNAMTVNGALTANTVTTNTVTANTAVNTPTVTATNVNANAVSGGILTATNGVVRVVKGTAPNAVFWLNDGTDRAAFYYDDATLQTIVVDETSGAQLTLDSVGNFHFNGTANAYKAGGGSWSTPSDARIKTVTGEYTAGLDEVLRLRPVSYTYKGNDAPPNSPSPTNHVEGRSFVGFVAQELERVMPNMVSRREGYVDGQKVTDLRDIDVSSLVFALVNAVKDLKAEIEALKAGR